MAALEMLETGNSYRLSWFVTEAVDRASGGRDEESFFFSR
jgi:hypothetical protein